jgi:Icc-related predicted phosphoesterase
MEPQPYRLLCISDTRGARWPVCSVDNVSATLFAGNFYNEGRPVSSDALPTGRVPPLYAVRGNHDVTDHAGFFKRAADVTGRVVQIAPRVFVGGIGWHGDSYSDLPLESDLEPVCKSVREQAKELLHDGDTLVLLSHYPAISSLTETFPPKEPRDGYLFRCVRELADELNPRLIVQGHVREWFRSGIAWRRATGQDLLQNPGPDGMLCRIEGRAAYPSSRQ